MDGLKHMRTYSQEEADQALRFLKEHRSDIYNAFIQNEVVHGNQKDLPQSFWSALTESGLTESTVDNIYLMGAMRLRIQDNLSFYKSVPANFRRWCNGPRPRP